MISWIKSLIVDYGAINVIIMALTILITNLIKKPIKDKAQKLTDTAKTLLGVDLDKSVITSNIVYIPIGISFILYFIYTIFAENFILNNIDWALLVSNSLIYGLLSVSLFDIFKSKLNAYKSKDTYEEVKKRLNEIKSAEESKTDSEGDLLIKKEDKENDNGKENN